MLQNGQMHFFIASAVKKMAKFFEIGHFQFFEIGHEMANLATLAMNKAQNPAFLSAIKEQKV